MQLAADVLEARAARRAAELRCVLIGMSDVFAAGG
jgi:hypothetical protein